MGYQRPKKRLHRGFTYLDHEGVLNSLSAFEAGTVDEIIQKTSEATDRGVEAAVGLPSAKAGGSRKRQAQVQQELVRARTQFSTFESWLRTMNDQEAIGRFDEWNDRVREELRVGDTVQFTANVTLSPLHLMLVSFMSFVKSANMPGSPFQASGKELAEQKNTAKMFEGWISGPNSGRTTTVYFTPFDSPWPRIVGRLEDQYVIGSLEKVQGEFTVVAQVDQLLTKDDEISAIRILRDVPPTPLETRTVGEALSAFQGEAAEEMGVELKDEDLTFSHPTVIVRPLAIFR